MCKIRNDLHHLELAIGLFFTLTGLGAGLGAASLNYGQKMED
jgi:hypothetical protein